MRTRRTLALACPHTAAVAAGREAFVDGGTAVDAALAACVTLAVVYPHMCSIGGDAIALVHAPDGTVTVVNGSGAAPAALDAARVRAALERDPARVTRTGMPVRGPHTVTVPGVLAAWETLRAIGAALPLERLLRPAIGYAAEGCEVSRSLAATLACEPGVFAADPGLREVFFRAATGPGGARPVADRVRDAGTSHDARRTGRIRPLAEGERFVQPALAASLEAVARAGVGVFYRGELGARFTAGLGAVGSVMTADDLAAHATEVTAPLRRSSFGCEVLTAPPNSQGYVLLQLLAAMELLGAGAGPAGARGTRRSRPPVPERPPDPLGPAAASLARLFRLASDERDRHLCDPRVHQVPLDDLLRPGHIAELARRGAARGRARGSRVGAARDHGVARGRAARDADAAVSNSGAPIGTEPTPGDTVACVAADSDGWAVTVIQSVYHAFGAAILEPDTGIVAHDRGACFSLDPASPNLLSGGVRPLHTLMPVMLFRDGRLATVAGTMGGEAQPQIHAQILARLLGDARRTGGGPAKRRGDPAKRRGGAAGDEGHGETTDPDAALAAVVAAPRWIVDEGRVFAEADLPETCLAALRSTHMPLELLEPRDETVGHAQCAAVGTDGALRAASDPRADGEAVVVAV